MDERQFEQAAALTERVAREGIQRALNRPVETPLKCAGRRVCRDCEAPIESTRIAANPDAVRCTECQNDRERETRRHG